MHDVTPSGKAAVPFALPDAVRLGRAVQVLGIHTQVPLGEWARVTHASAQGEVRLVAALALPSRQWRWRDSRCRSWRFHLGRHVAADPVHSRRLGRWQKGMLGWCWGLCHACLCLQASAAAVSRRCCQSRPCLWCWGGGGLGQTLPVPACALKLVRQNFLSSTQNCNVKHNCLSILNQRSNADYPSWQE